MPICVTDTDPNETFNLYKGDITNPDNKLASSTTPTADQYTGFSYNSTLQAYTTNYKQVFGTADLNVTLPTKEFIITDHTGAESNAGQFKLTLLPATIGMTVSTSTAGYNYNAAGTAITGSYNDNISPYLGPYQLKYGEQLNFSCDKTTKMAVYSSAKNNTLPLLKDLSACNNYSSNQILKNRCLYVFICFY